MAQHVIHTSKEGLPVIYDEDSREIQYKDTKVPFAYLKRAINSDLDRVQLSPTLTMVKSGEIINFGCLTLTMEICKSLINIITWNRFK